VGDEIEGCGKDASKDKYKLGCLDLFEDQFLSNIGIVGGVVIGLAFLQFIGVFFACCIGRKIGNGNEYV